MGMIFNTQQTNTLIGYANGALVAGGFARAANDATLKGYLATIGTTTNLHDHVWNHLGLGNAGVAARLGFWLRLLDTIQQNGHPVSYWIGQWILNALNNTGRYAGVEFFAVPDTNISVSQRDFQDLNNGGNKYTLVITICTDVVDKYPHHP